MTARRPTAVKPWAWPKPLALPLWVGGAVVEFISEAWHGRRTWRIPPRDLTASPQERPALAALRRAILGRGKPIVAAVLGPPPTALLARSAGGYLDCDTWYYPLCREVRWCMAVTFESDRAKRVEFFRGLAQ